MTRADERPMDGRRLAAVMALSAVLFALLFRTGGLGAFDFWWWMGANSALLIGLSLILDRSYGLALMADLSTRPLPKIAWGLGSAAVLYGVFWGGNILSRAWFGGWAGEGIDAVYGLKSTAGMARIVLLITLLIGPAEEVLWRGLLQRQIARRRGRWPAVLLATALYGAVHVSSGNPMLVIAALVCGVFWGLLYLWRGSVLLNVVSHTAWDLAVFVLFPFSTP